MDADRENNNIISRDASARRKVQYRELLDKVEEIQETEDLGIHTITEIGDIFKAVRILDNECDIKDRVEHADETLLDSMVLSSTSDILLKCVKAVDGHKISYDPVDFAQKIVNAIKPDESEDTDSLDFSKLFEDARAIIPEVPNFSFLYGAYDTDKVLPPKEKKKRVKEIQENANKEKLINVSNVETGEAGIEDTLHFLLKVLREEYEKNQNQPIDYFKYLVDKESFSSTIENMFYFSFLLRDGKAKLFIDENAKKPVVAPVKKKELKAFRDHKGVNTQMITSITMDMWEEIDVSEGYVQRHKKILKKA